ncbi:adenylosuccinate synthase [Ramicandelaber brevisporus]|nr:adenylosuccinate synthase [Ramicandelaber brevisporus]
MSSNATINQVQCVLGAVWGDEGKGKLTDILAQSADVCARAQGGNNAGHSISVNGVSYSFHLLPSGLIAPGCVGLIGSGVVVNLPDMFAEIEALERKGLTDVSKRIFVSDRAHLVFDFHKIVDGLKEVELGGKSIGTTKRGIGPTYSSKASRSGIRVHHLFEAPEVLETRLRTIVENRFKRYGQFEYDVDAELLKYKAYAERLKPMVVDAVAFMHKRLADPTQRILVEGANALFLDIDYGTYPFVTSSNTSIGGVLTGLGIPPNRIGKIYGVVKAYTTRVGMGPFPTELLNDIGVKLQEDGHEYGTTTGRRRRCGWLDLVMLRYSHMINGYTVFNLTKLDVLDTFESIKVAVAYKLTDPVTGETSSLDYYPADLSVLEKVEVEYVVLPGWMQDISKCRTYDELPENARKYIEFIEEQTGVPVEFIGVGVDRDAMVRKP